MSNLKKDPKYVVNIPGFTPPPTSQPTIPSDPKYVVKDPTGQIEEKGTPVNTGSSSQQSPSSDPKYVVSTTRRSRSRRSRSRRSTPAPTPTPAPSVELKEVKTESGTTFKGDYSGDTSYKPGESYTAYQNRMSQEVQNQARQEAERLSQERGEEVKVSLSYTPAFLPFDEKENKELFEEKEERKYFGTRQKGKETTTQISGQTFNLFSSTPSKPIGMISPAPERSNLGKASDFLSSEMTKVESGESNVPGVAIGLAQIGVGATKEAINLGRAIIRPRQTARAIGQGITETIKDPVGTFDRVTYDFGQNLQYNTGETVGAIGFHIALSRGLGKGTKIASNKINTAVANAKMSKGYTQATWRVDTPAVALTTKEALAQKSGIQTTLGTYQKGTFKGSLISDKALYDARTSAGLEPLKKSPLGLPPEHYSKIQKSSGKGTNLRLDDSVSYINYETITVQQANKKIFTLSEVVNKGQDTIVSTGIKTIGTKPSGLNQPRIRAVDTITGKEYNIPANFLERRLIEQPSLSVIGQPSRQLFSADPVGALVLATQDAFKLSPQFSKTTTPSTPIIKPVFSNQKPTQTGINPLLSTASIKRTENTFISVEEQDKLKKEKEQISYTITPILKDTSAVKTSSDIISKTTEQEKTETGTIISPRSLSRTSSRSMTASKIDTISETITATTPITTTSPGLTQKITKTPTKQIPNPYMFPSPRLTSSPMKQPEIKNIFSLLVRRSGTFSPVGTFSNLRQTFGEGQRIVGETAAASFKVKDSKGEVVNPVWGMISNRFRPAKSEQGVVVERRRYRISSPGELQEITYKGLMTQRGKKKQRYSFF